ncbi:hypothetical protein RIF29_28050 [Crotalaria pallida]|uniref:Uncharacterized protein n=1 Tax=Crotalaria pallida TaxID=3830 RepID=A0AAN9EQQ1_CROPI
MTMSLSPLVTHKVCPSLHINHFQLLYSLSFLFRGYSYLLLKSPSLVVHFPYKPLPLTPLFPYFSFPFLSFCAILGATTSLVKMVEVS